MQVCCKFDSKSVELSDEESYTKERCKEATQEIGVLVSGSYGLIEASGSTSYSKREKFKEFKSTTAKIKRLLTVLFEATAICTKFDVRLVSNVDPTVKASFNYGQMSSLSMAEEKTKQIALKSTLCHRSGGTNWYVHGKRGRISQEIPTVDSQSTTVLFSMYVG